MKDLIHICTTCPDYPWWNPDREQVYCGEKIGAYTVLRIKLNFIGGEALNYGPGSL